MDGKTKKSVKLKVRTHMEVLANRLGYDNAVMFKSLDKIRYVILHNFLVDIEYDFAKEKELLSKKILKIM